MSLARNGTACSACERSRPCDQRRRSISAQKMAGYGVAAVAAVLVLYPVFFLLQAALDVGDPQVRPPTAYGFDNFSGLLQYPQILLNTLTVSFAATVMALVFGFVMAWILTRTNVPGRRLFEQLMAVPYYLTPLLGALAWSLLGSPESGFINQIWRALGGQRPPHRHQHRVRHRLGHGAVRGLGRLRHDRRGDEIDGPLARGGLAGHGREPAAHHAAHHLAAGRARRARRRHLRLRRNARLVRRRARARPAQPLLRHHHRDLPAGPAISAEDPGRGRDGRVAVRRDVRHAVRVPAHRDGRQLRDHHRQGVPAAGGRRRAAALCAARRLRALSVRRRRSCRWSRCFMLRCRRSPSTFPAAENFTLDNFRIGHDDECRALGARQQPAARASAPRRSASC